jgi:hypothetical protein
MRELELLRRVQRKEVRKALGSHPLSPAIQRAQVLVTGRESAYHAWPVSVDNLAPIQDLVTGQSVFMVGMSTIGGSDIIHGSFTVGTSPAGGGLDPII